MDLSSFPRVSLGHFPTPLEPMPRLAEALGGPQLFVKRDDCTGLATGGNKTRKLEFLMADALEKGADTVITQGAVQSNHVRQTVAAACKMGLGSYALLEQRLENAPEVYEHSGNVFLDRLYGATIEHRPAGTDMNAEMEAIAERLRDEGRKPYIIPGGGSNAIGALSYVGCLTEIVEQAGAMGLKVDHIVTATGSSGTQAGLVAGMAAMGLDIPIHGISVRFDKQTQEQKVYDLALRTADYMGTQEPARESVIAFDGYVGPGYGHPTPSMVEAVTLCARTEGLLLDPVYSGKGMAGMIDLIRNKVFGEDEVVVFLHTGGSASLFAYDWAFEQEWQNA
jgi:L-cysteate sulfo-lyase